MTTIKRLGNSTFEDVVTLAWNTMRIGTVGKYTRAQAQDFVIRTYDNTYVLEVDGVVAGAYSYFELPNVYSLNFFALAKKSRKSRSGYKLYKHMSEKLKGRPVNVPMYYANEDMKKIVSKRGVLVGRYPHKDGTIIDYYSITFNNFQKRTDK